MANCGNCFEASFKALLALPEDERPHWRLCHGVAIGTGGEPEGRRYVHAWLERVVDIEAPHPLLRRIVRDVANGKDMTLPAIMYYGAGQIHHGTVRRYTFEEAGKLALQTGHYGCWEDFVDVYWGEQQ